jgi:hypothetical protein
MVFHKKIFSGLDIVCDYVPDFVVMPGNHQIGIEENDIQKEHGHQEDCRHGVVHSQNAV